MSPIPECPTPDHGSRGLTRSQQFQYTVPARTRDRIRRARRPFDEESRRKAPPEPAPRALTLNNDSRASNPGRIKVQFFKYWSCFPTWPTLGSLSVLIFLAVGSRFWVRKFCFRRTVFII